MVVLMIVLLHVPNSQGGILFNTATNIFNVLLLDDLLVVEGSVVYLNRKRGKEVEY